MSRGRGLVAAFSLLAGCAALPPAPLGSPTDEGYRWRRAQGAAVPAGESSAGVGFYRAVLSRALFSECALFPSDSEYAQFVFRRCGAWHGTLAAMARYYWEPSAERFGDRVIRGRAWGRDRLLRVDFSEECGPT